MSQARSPVPALLLAALVLSYCSQLLANEDSKRLPVVPGTALTVPNRPDGAPSSPGTSHLRAAFNADLVPRVTPGYSETGLKSNAVLPLLAKAGPWFNKNIVYNNVDKAYTLAVKGGLELLKSTGQRGMLLQITVLEQATPGAQTYYSIYGEGVRMVGVGPDAHSAALKFYRHGVIELPIPAGAKMSPDSQFVWLEPTPKGFNVSTYSLELANWVRTLSAAQVAAVDRTGQALAMDEYLGTLHKRARTVETRKVVAELVRSRTLALIARQNAQNDLNDELRRQERIAQAQAGLSALSMALSLSSAIAAATTTTGTDLEQVELKGSGEVGANKIESFADLAAALNLLMKSSNAKSVQLEIRTKTLNTEVGTLDEKALTLGVEFGLDPSKAPILRIDPHN